MHKKLKRIAIKTLKIDLGDVLESEHDSSITNVEKDALKSISSVTSEVKGDGRAVFFTDGTEAEYLDYLEHESKWYNVFKKWGLK